MNVNFTKPPSVLDKDPYFNNVSLLMHMNGVSGSKNFVDSSANNIQSTAIGNIEVSSTRTQFGNGAAFLYGNGTGNYIRVSGNPNLAVGTGDYTLEMWAYISSDSPFVIFDAAPINSPGSRPDAFLFYIENNREPRFFGNGLTIATSAGSLPINQWAHLALVRNTGTTTIYINGTGISNSTGFYNATLATGGCLIGTFTDSLNFTSNGYIDELRLTKGVARYTGNFTPPTTEFPDNSSQPKSLRFLKSNDGKKTLLRPVNLPIGPVTPIPSNYLAFWKLDDLTDSSANANTLFINGNVQFVTGKVGNCAQFPGSNSAYLRDSELSSTFNPNGPAGEFTISCWINPASFSDYQAFLGSSANGFIIHTDSAGALYCNEGSSGDATIGSLLQLNQWQHIVFVKSIASGNRTKVWYNGNKVYDQLTNNINNYQAKNIITLGNYGSFTFPYNGKLDMVGLWNRELTQSEIDILYNNGNGREP